MAGDLGAVGVHYMWWHSRSNGECFLPYSLLGRLLGMVLYLEIDFIFGCGCISLGWFVRGWKGPNPCRVGSQWPRSEIWSTDVWQKGWMCPLHSLPLRGWGLVCSYKILIFWWFGRVCLSHFGGLWLVWFVDVWCTIVYMKECFCVL